MNGAQDGRLRKFDVRSSRVSLYSFFFFQGEVTLLACNFNICKDVNIIAVRKWTVGTIETLYTEEDPSRK